MLESRRTVTEVARRFAEYVNRVAYRGERFTLVRGNRPVAELRPVPAGRTLAELPELLRGLPSLGADEVERFDRDLQEARREMNEWPERDPWGS